MGLRIPAAPSDPGWEPLYDYLVIWGGVKSLSTRYGIELVFEPAFTSRVYRARQLVCGQYASWAAEMHMLRMGVISYFKCADNVLDLLAHGVARIAQDSRDRSPRFSIRSAGISANREERGVSLDFQYAEGSQNEVKQVDFGPRPNQTSANHHPLSLLHSDAVRFIQEFPGGELPPDAADFRPRINLIECATMPTTVLADAADFARGVSIDLAIPCVARAWRLALLRYNSDAAGEDWSNGSWAADLRWECLASYVL